jgi:8-oxo-dGTP diphosphatase
VSTKKRIHVVVGIIAKGDDVCIARRSVDSHLGGLWEFPGGKVEEGETAFEGLQRELFEEIGIQVQAADPIMQLPHDYSERLVLLDFWLVKEFFGEPHGREGQLVSWVKRVELLNYHFPEANRPVKDMLIQGKL